ncbi:ABC transporter [Nocardioides hungaricus]
MTGSRGAMWALARAEARRMLLHPAFALAVAAVTVPWLVGLVSRGGPPAYATLSNASWQIQMPLLIVAAGAFFSAHLTAVRRYRFETTEAELVQPMPRWQQSAAQMVAVAALAVATAVLVIVDLSVQAAGTGAAGSVLPAEAATAPAYVLLAGVLGASAAHVGRSISAGVSVFVVVGVATFAGVIGTGRAWRWLTLAAFENTFEVPAVPAMVAQRPAGWHVAWLLALCLLLVLVTLGVNGLSRPLVLAGSAVAAVLAVVAGIAQLGAAPLMGTRRWNEVFEHPARVQTCRTREPVTYCAFPDFTSRIGAWSSIAQAQLAAVPAAVAAGPIYVRQRLPARGSNGFGYLIPEAWSQDDAAAGTPGAVAVSTRWAGVDDDSFAQTQVLAFALGFGYRLAYGTSAKPADGKGGGVELCGGPGVVTLWLAAGTQAAGRAAVSAVLARGDLVQASVAESAVDLIAGYRETTVLQGLLDRDQPAVTRQILDNWARLTDPATDVDRAAEILGVSAGPRLSEEIGLCAGAGSAG